PLLDFPEVPEGGAAGREDGRRTRANLFRASSGGPCGRSAGLSRDYGPPMQLRGTQVHSFDVRKGRRPALACRGAEATRRIARGLSADNASVGNPDLPVRRGPIRSGGL